MISSNIKHINPDIFHNNQFNYQTYSQSFPLKKILSKVLFWCKSDFQKRKNLFQINFYSFSTIKLAYTTILHRNLGKGYVRKRENKKYLKE